jgi:integrase
VQMVPRKSGDKWRARLPITEDERLQLGLKNREYWGPSMPLRSSAMPSAKKQLKSDLLAAARRAENRLSDVVDEALIYWEATGQKATTLDLKRRLRDKHLSTHPIWNEPASELTSKDMAIFATQIIGSRHSKRNVCSLVTAALKLRGFTIKPDFPIIAPEKQSELIEACQTDEERLLILLALRCGLRRGEMAGLMREHCRKVKDSPRIYVTEQISTISGAHIIHDPKTENSTTWVPVDEETWGLLEPRRGYILTGTTEHRLPGWITGQVKRIGARVGLEITPHDLRHNCGMNWIEAGVPPTKVARLLRDRLETVLRIYLRENEEGLDGLAVDIFSKLSSHKGSRKANDIV